jgi:hypothetical protein
MNPPKCDELDYINFLMAASTVEAAQIHRMNAPQR